MNHQVICTVIRILSPTTIVIETEKTNLSIGDRIEIFVLADELKNLKGESLGPIPVIKDKLQIDQVEKGFILCSKPFDRQTAFPISPLLDQRKSPRRNLKVNNEEIEPLSEIQLDTITRGDLVRLAWRNI